METQTAKRYLAMTHNIEGYDGYSFCSEAEQLALEVIDLHRCISIFCREERGLIDFDNDNKAINYFRFKYGED